MHASNAPNQGYALSVVTCKSRRLNLTTSVSSLTERARRSFSISSPLSPSAASASSPPKPAPSYRMDRREGSVLQFEQRAGPCGAYKKALASRSCGPKPWHSVIGSATTPLITRRGNRQQADGTHWEKGVLHLDLVHTLNQDKGHYPLHRHQGVSGARLVLSSQPSSST